MIKKEVLEALDYYKILTLIEEFASSEATIKEIKNIHPSDNITEAEKRLEEFKSIKKYFDNGGTLPISSFPDIRALISRASKEGAFFEAWELTGFLRVLRVLDRVSSCINQLIDFPALAQKIGLILGNDLSVGQPYLLERLERTVDEDGNILDTATPMLQYLRKQIRITEERIKEKLEEIVNRKDIVIFLQDSFITKRNDRWVIPVRMDSKGQVKGKVYDVSRSGDTAFVEPEEISLLSKKLEELKIEERVEEIRILRELSDYIHQIANTLEREFTLLVYLDKMNAIYHFSNRFSANIPSLTNERLISLIEAKHPLLMISKNQVEPLNLNLSDKKVLVISGPNAGGKTVTLKTIGILTAMANAGLPIPASPSSTIPFVDAIYVDLSHEGSIEEHLSSFASHLITLKEIIEKANSESLILLDEIGTNTDPEEGAALACAIIEELKNRGSLTFVTTHLSKVKLFAATDKGMEVGAMLFDENTMTPLYRLSIGNLTTSYALEIAQKYGFPETLIKRAHELKGTGDRNIYELMKELERTKEEYRIKIAELEKIEKSLATEKERLEIENAKIEEKKRKLMQEAKEEAEGMIQKLKKEINFLYEEAKRADKRRLKEISESLRMLSREFQGEALKDKEEIKVGEVVKLRKLKLSGKVLSIEEGRVKIQTEKAQIEASIDEVEKILIDKEQTHKENTVLSNGKQTDLEIYPRKIDLRGMRVDEAISMLERFLNELSLNEASFGLILHGIGKGILRDTIRDYLKDHPAVKAFRKGDTDEGGDAVTVVEMR
ncbi:MULTISPECIES: endonuclease MutS2 [Thermodesulfovibrio]|uniref:endonuclease MutS2 n=1 Tax=Thermodesulfovibrio TaxID=28261 RepID=UPI0026375A53|nr:Smr/MutS family protein [Thermodesulfovibrio sp.]